MNALGDEEMVRRVLEDPSTAAEPRLRHALGFIRKLLLSPSEVAADDVRPLLAAGASRQAVADAVYVCFLFSTYTRLADTLGWEIPSEAAFQAGARKLLTRGYL